MRTMRSLSLLLLLVAAGCEHPASPISQSLSSPLCVWHFDVPNFTSDSDETPAARCSYSTDGSGNVVTFFADVPNRFSLQLTARPYETVLLPAPNRASFDVTGGCPQWGLGSYVKMGGPPSAGNDFVMVEAKGQCNGFSIDGFVLRNRPRE